MPINASGIANRNGTRQPQVSKASPEIHEESDTITVPSSSPAETPVCGQEPKNPRFSRGAFSTATIAAPPHSPPTAKPWASRSAHSSNGAATPIVVYVGRNPISAVATVMIVNVMIRVDFRPILSPRWPATKAPTGRARKPTPKVASATI